jgi:hypothetical protein
MRYLASLLFSIVLLTSCFHNNVMSDRAAAAFIYSGPEENLTVAQRHPETSTVNV